MGVKRICFILLMTAMVLAGCQNAQDERDGGFLWKAENGDTTVYLQGTIHVGNEDFYPLNDTIENAYKEADVVLPEIDLNNMDEAEVMPLTMELATYEGNQTLRDNLPDDVFLALEEILQENGVPAEMMEHFRPWFVETLLMQLALEDSAYSPEYGVDVYFLDRALEDGKEVQELESYEDQMRMLAGFSEEIQIEMLESAVAYFDDMADELDELAGFWLDGDTEALSEVSEAEADTFEGYDEYMEEMNTNRNIDMADSILKLLEEDSGQTYFVIVGAMHMVEEPSIVSLIEEGGFEAEHIY